MEIPWELFPSTRAAIAPALERALAHMLATGRPYALVMQKGTVAAYALKQSTGAVGRREPAANAGPGGAISSFYTQAARPSRHDALREVIAHTPVSSTIVLATTGFCGRELYAIEDRPNQLVYRSTDHQWLNP